MRLLTKLAEEAKLTEKIADMFAGKHLNVTEDRAVSTTSRGGWARAADDLAAASAYHYLAWAAAAEATAILSLLVPCCPKFVL